MTLDELIEELKRIRDSRSFSYDYVINTNVESVSDIEQTMEGEYIAEVNLKED